MTTKGDTKGQMTHSDERMSDTADGKRKTPKISVLMPVYNGEKYLKIAVDSILSQSFRDFEFIAVDDGSTDGTRAILESYQDDRIRIVSAGRQGIIGALNFGYAHCTGDYVARMDADDISEPARFELQVRFLDEHPEVSVVCSSAWGMDQNGRRLALHPSFDPSRMLIELACRNPIVHGTVMMRRKDLPPPPIYTGVPEDYALWIDLCQAGKKFAVLDTPLYHFRTHQIRYSLVAADRLSGGLVKLQAPLLRQAKATQSVADPFVLTRLIQGFGSVAGSAFRSQQLAEGIDAEANFRRLVALTMKSRLDTNKQTDQQSFQASIDHGIEAILWGGCPYFMGLRWRLWQVGRDLPRRQFKSFRNLVIYVAERAGVLRLRDRLLGGRNR